MEEGEKAKHFFAHLEETYSERSVVYKHGFP